MTEAQGSEHSFEAAVLPYRAELHAAALRLTRNPSDAEDLLQETLIRAFTAWERFEPGSNARAWAHRILVNTFISQYRRRKRHRKLSQESRGDALLGMHGTRSEACDPRSEMFSDELGDEVSQALSGLGPEQREVVELADLRGVRYREIADKLRVPIGTVMSRLFRARRNLESKLSGFASSQYGIRRVA